MSVLNRQVNPKLKRSEIDYYPTKAIFAFAHSLNAIYNLSPYYDEYKILDVGVGGGVYGAALYQLMNSHTDHDFLLHGIDVTLENLPEQHPYDFVYDGDFLNFELTTKYDLIIGNPPYKNVIKFVERGLSMLSRGGILSFLLKTSFLESKERFDFFKTKRPFNIIMLANRPIKKHAESYCIVNWCNDYYGGSTDSTFVDFMYVTKDGYERI